MSATLRWPLHLAAKPALDHWSVRCGTRLDWFVPVRPYSADLIQWSTIGEVRCSIWGSTGFSDWATVVYSVHSGCSACRRQARSLTASVCKRLSSLAHQLSAPQLLSTSYQHAWQMLRPHWKPVVSVLVQVMWLGSQQLLSRLDIADVSILSSRNCWKQSVEQFVAIPETTRTDVRTASSDGHWRH